MARARCWYRVPKHYRGILYFRSRSNTWAILETSAFDSDCASNNTTLLRLNTAGMHGIYYVYVETKQFFPNHSNRGSKRSLYSFLLKKYPQSFNVRHSLNCATTWSILWNMVHHVTSHSFIYPSLTLVLTKSPHGLLSLVCIYYISHSIGVAISYVYKVLVHIRRGTAQTDWTAVVCTHTRLATMNVSPKLYCNEAFYTYSTSSLLVIIMMNLSIRATLCSKVFWTVTSTPAG